MIPGDILSACPHRQFDTLPGLSDSWAALPNSYPNACMPMQGGSLYHFYDGLWYDPAERRTHDLPCERRTRYRLSQPDTVLSQYQAVNIITCLPKTRVFSRQVFSSEYLGVKYMLISFFCGKIILFNVLKLSFVKYPLYMDIDLNLFEEISFSKSS